MNVLRPFRAAGSALLRAPRAVGRASVRTVQSRALPWALFVVSIGVAGVFAQLWQRGEAVEDRRGEVLTVARGFVGALTNFQAATIEQDVARIRSFAVGDFAEQVGTFFDRETIDRIKEAEARSIGTVQSVFVQSLAGDTASVFGVVNESTVNKDSPVPRTEVVRLDIQMIRTPTGWRVSRVEILQSPGTVPFGG